MKKSSLIIGALLTFVLNLVWENLQAPLYQGYESFGQHFWICFVASLGDVVIVGAIYALLALLFRDMHWVNKLDMRQIFPVLSISFLIAVGVEKWGLITSRWQYAGMPLIPVFNVGIFPILQMLILPPIVFYLMKKAYNR